MDQRKLLRKFKEKYNLTWANVASIFGRSMSSVMQWLSGRRKIPSSTRRLLRIFIDHPQVFDSYRLEK